MRGLPFTEEEADAVVDAFMDAAERSDQSRAIEAAKAALERLEAMPLEAARRQRDLAKLRSISQAYLTAQTPEPFRTLWAR